METRLAHCQPRKKRPDSGQSLLEIALLTPMLALMLLGVIEIGRYAYVGILVGNAAKAGAAYAAQNLPYAAPSNQPLVQAAAVKDFQDNGRIRQSISVSVVDTCGCDNGGSFTSAACNDTLTAGTCAAGHWIVMVSVTCSGTFNSLFNYPLLPSSLTVSRTAIMRVAQR